MGKIKLIAALFVATATAILLLSALAFAHHVTSTSLTCSQLTFKFDADTGEMLRLDWNHDALIQDFRLVGRGTLTLDVPAAALSKQVPTSVKITALPALDEGFVLLQTSAACLK